jgi:hypothetical protein
MQQANFGPASNNASSDKAQYAAQPRLSAVPADSRWPVLAETIFKRSVLTVWVLGGTTAEQLLAEQLSPAALEDLLWMALSAAPTNHYGDEHTRMGEYDTGSTAPMCRLTHAVFDDECFERISYKLQPAVRQWQQQVQASLQQLPLAAQQQLMGRLLLRGHAECAEAAETHLAWRATPSAVTAALRRYVVQLAHVQDRRWLLDVLRSIARVQSAEQLSGEQVASLMHAAVVNQQHKVLEILFCMPAAQQLSTAQYSALLDAACTHGDTH